jgi:hypothetical protein
MGGSSEKARNAAKGKAKTAKARNGKIVPKLAGLQGDQISPSNTSTAY